MSVNRKRRRRKTLKQKQRAQKRRFLALVQDAVDRLRTPMVTEFKPDFHFSGTASGRTSSVRPNLQHLPRIALGNLVHQVRKQGT